MHKERKETTHEKIGERTVITTLSYIYITSWVQGLLSQSENYVSLKEERKKKT